MAQRSFTKLKRKKMQTKILSQTSLRAEAVSLQTAKKFLRIDGNYEDDLIAVMLSGACQLVGERLGVSFDTLYFHVLADTRNGFDVMALPGNRMGGVIITSIQDAAQAGWSEIKYTVNATADDMAAREVLLQVYNDYHHPDRRKQKKRYHI